jgi:hypothetical protein
MRFKTELKNIRTFSSVSNHMQIAMNPSDF